MKHCKQLTAAALSALLLGSVAVPVGAAPLTAEKQEVIYVMTDASGCVTDMEAVNMFAGGDITDYGDYSSVKMLNTTDEILQKGDRISISSSADKVYYQGTLRSTVIPWDISIRYFLDGKELSPDRLAGKSGDLEIRFSVSKNPDCSGSFYESHALQATFLLDGDLCTDITAEGATLAHVGTDQQLSYTILPGRGVDAVIRASVTDFAMDPVTINGINLNLQVDFDSSSIMGDVSQLIQATRSLRNGASTIHNEMGRLKTGSDSLASGAANLHQGLSSLDAGIDSLQGGVSSMQSGLDRLQAQSGNLTAGSSAMKSGLKTLQDSLSGFSTPDGDLSALVSGSASVKAGLRDLTNGAATLRDSVGYSQFKAQLQKNGLNIDTLKAGNVAAIASVTALMVSLQNTASELAAIPGCESQAQQIQSQAASLKTVLTVLTGDSAALSGTELYLNALSNGAAQLYQGAATLSSSYTALDDGISTLADALSETPEKISALTEGVNTLVEKYAELDAGVNSYTNGVDSAAAGFGQISDGVSSLSEGSKPLLTGAEALQDGTEALQKGTGALYDGTSQLSGGAETLSGKTSGMSTWVQDKMDSILASISGEDVEPESFVSEKNTAVTAVQFVIKTEAIEAPEAPEVQEDEPESMSLWQKFLHLFGID
ncbi:MAG: hypothetical protein HUJ67_07595 [Ruminiclostridium sp.]|nr:hypothetical protein [Ruminiclostridium sp.]MCF0167493.1 hypothetical protein [Bacteroidales bacterium]